MTAKQARFVKEYLKDLNGTQAAIRCGYSPKTAAEQASRLLTNAKIAPAVAAGKAAQLESAELSAVRTLEEIRRLATVDMRSFFDESGNMKPIHELTPEQGACLSGFEVIKKNAEAGDGHTDRVHKFKVWDKPRALEMLAKHFALLTEKIEHSGGIDLKWLE